MADTRMSKIERETFLAALHVGVLCIPRGERAPLSAPIWYDYAPGGDIWVLIGAESRKGRMLAVGGTVSLVAQQEAAPYRYVTVEGDVTALEPCGESDTLTMAQRYLGEEGGKAYAAGSGAGSALRVSITPRKWLSVDYAKS